VHFEALATVKLSREHSGMPATRMSVFGRPLQEQAWNVYTPFTVA
jgi:hypothetical protein